jgi:hypothetical protein
MKILIDISQNENPIGERAWYGKIFLDGKWFKDIGMFVSIPDLIKAVGENEDFAEEVLRLGKRANP